MMFVLPFLDKFPNTEGQTLVIPKEEIDYLFDLEQETYDHVMNITKKVAEALDQALETERTCIVIEGFEIPHSHVRMYPVKERNLDISSGPEKTLEELEEVAEKIRRFM